MTTLISEKEVIANINDGIEELEACANGPTSTDTVLAWPNHLGVKFINGKASAIDIVKADAFDRLTIRSLPTVTNGKGEKAIPMKRGEVAASQAENLRKILKDGFPHFS